MKHISKIAAISLIALLPLSGCNSSEDDKNEAKPVAAKISKTKAVEAKVTEAKPTEAKADTKPAAIVEPTPVAIVNGVKISKLMFDKHAEYRTGGKKVQLSPDQRKGILDELISLELLKQDAIKKEINKQDDVIALIENHKRGAIAQAGVLKLKESNAISDEDLQKKYDEYSKTNSSEYNANHILLKTEEEAKNVIKEINEGGTFAELAKKHSVGPTGKNGGNLGWFGPKQMVKEFSDAVKTLTVGEYTKEPVMTKFGWHVILLQETRPATIVPFEQMKKQLRLEEEGKMIQDYLANLKEQGTVEILLK